jgi:hypothetical protein
MFIINKKKRYQLTSLQGHEKQLGMLSHVFAAGHEGNINFPMKCTTKKQNITQILKNVTVIFSSAENV